MFRNIFSFHRKLNVDLAKDGIILGPNMVLNFPISFPCPKGDCSQPIPIAAAASNNTLVRLESIPATFETLGYLHDNPSFFILSTGRTTINTD